MISVVGSKRRAFTLIELLVVIAIIAILASILFPVFATVREKGRITACVSNLKQFSEAITEYTQDSDENMPVAYKENHEAGPLMATLFNEPQQGVSAQVMPYIQSNNVFRCPDDAGFEADDRPTNTVPDQCALGMHCTGPHGGLAASNPDYSQIVGQSFELVYGSSYKIVRQDFSNPFSTTNTTGFKQNITECGPGGTVELSGAYIPAPGDTCKKIGPAVLALNYFNRPSETRMLRCYDAPFKMDDNHIWHPQGMTVAYVDGHAKFINSLAAFNNQCDGADWAWDVAGSCNTKGLQRTASNTPGG
jgi:prepilin-type N-terminal cleavage/methylation domain-containing protein/prepilin-type processing-associated H-X9-DG protein